MRVAITGLGATCASGLDLTTVWSAVLTGKSSARLLDAVPEIGLQGVAVSMCSTDFPLPGLPPHALLDLDRVSLFSLHAAQQALSQAESQGQALDRASLHVLWGCSMGGLSTLDAGYSDLLIRHKKRVRPTTVPMAMPSAPAFHVAHHFGLKGTVSTLSAACASSALAIGQACRMIERGEARQVLVGGVDSMLAPAVLRAWQASGALARADAAAPHTSCRPFDASRSGFTMGDGAAALLLESADSALSRQAPVLGWVRGFGHTSDTAHISRPSQEPQAAAMRAALQDAGISRLEEVDYVNAHGTATVLGDAVEAASIREVFQSRGEPIPVSSTKQVHGHLLGGAGALEAVVTLLALRQGLLPPNAHLQTLGDDVAPLRVLREACQVRPGGLALSNSFAFGGVNAVLALQAAID
jgi:3-oxoacyl-[acyl-carrier-protein] synthase II